MPGKAKFGSNLSMNYNTYSGISANYKTKTRCWRFRLNIKFPKLTQLLTNFKNN